MGIFEVAGDKTFEALLSSSVPELKTDDLPSSGDILADEIDPDGWLTHTTSTFLVGSNSLRM